MERIRADGSRCRAAMALIAAAVFTTSATPQRATAQTQEWFDREFQDSVFGLDNAVDIAYWREDATHEWVYVTGYHTTLSGATVFATSKYLATYTGPGENDPFIPTVFYPPIGTATGTHRAVAIEIDQETGDVYVTGESSDPSGNEGLDYVIIKYDKFLVVDTGWVNPQRLDGVVRWDNPTYDGVNSHDRPVDIALGRQHDVAGGNNNVIGVTGRSYGGLAVGDDIATVLLDAVTGDPFTGWIDISWDEGVRAFDGGVSGDDSAVELDLVWRLGMESQSGLHTYVAGTTRSLNNGLDIVTIKYDPAGNRSGSEGWTNVYDGPMHDDDVATAMRLQRR